MECSVCKGEIKTKDEYGFPLYYINEAPIMPWEWDEDWIKEVVIFCSPDCSLIDHEIERGNYD